MPWAERRPLATRAGAGLLAGVLVAGSLPPFGLWPLAFVGLGLLAAACHGAGARVRLVTGFLAGVGQFAIGLAFAARFSLLGAAVLVVFEAGFVALACWCAPRGRGALPALAGLLTLAEAARGRWPFGGLPMGGVALGQAGGPFLAVARLGGPVAVAGVTYLAGAALAALARRGRRRGGVIALAGAAGLVVAGVLVPSGGPPGAALRVALVQGGGPRGLTALEDPSWLPYDATLRAARTIRPGSARLVVLPEDVVRLPGPLAGSPADRRLGSLARHLGATVVAGVTEPVGKHRFDNELVAWGPSGDVVARFEKVHPVPFGEYVPFRSFVAHFANLAAVPRDAVVGRGTGAVSTPSGRLALLVSFEDFFTARGRSGVDAGGRLLVLGTNTASYATSQVPSQELAASRLQAVAEGRDLVQAATTGFSGFVAASGAVRARSRLGAPAVVEVTAHLQEGRTPYDVLGSAPALGAAGAMALLGIAVGERERRRGARRAQPTSAESSPSPEPALDGEPAVSSAGDGSSFLKRTPLKRRNLPTHMSP